MAPPEFEETASNAEGLRATRRWLLWSGIALLLIGIGAVMLPLLATLVVELFIGWVFLCAGIAALLRAFSDRHDGVRFGALALGVLRMLFGGYLVVNPAAGALVLAIVIAALLIADGALSIFGAFLLRPFPGWGWALSAGIVGMLAGVLVASGLPGHSVVLLGTIVGATLIVDGVACLGRYSALGR